MSVMKVERKSNVVFVELNRPEVKNAMNQELIDSLFNFFAHEISGDDRAVVLSGSGAFFCAGGDLQWMKASAQKTKEENEAEARQLGKMLQAIDFCPVPTIALVEGGAYGGGIGVVAACDIVIAEDQAQFSMSEVKLGLIPATVGPLVMRKIDYSTARRLYLTGHRFDAEEARNFHLVHEVVRPEDLIPLRDRYLKQILASGPKATRRAKALIRQLAHENLWEKDICEQTSKELAEIRVGEEAQEGIQAFFEKRKASWVMDWEAF